MRKISIYLIIIMIIISLSGCSRKQNSVITDNHVVDNHEISDTIEDEDKNQLIHEDDEKDQTVIDEKKNDTDEKKGTEDKGAGTTEAEDNSGSVGVTENLEIEIGEDQEVGGF